MQVTSGLSEAISQAGEAASMVPIFEADQPRGQCLPEAGPDGTVDNEVHAAIHHEKEVVQGADYVQPARLRGRTTLGHTHPRRFNRGYMVERQEEPERVTDRKHNHDPCQDHGEVIIRVVAPVRGRRVMLRCRRATATRGRVRDVRGDEAV